MLRTPPIDGPPERHHRKPGLGSRLRQAVGGGGGQANAPEPQAAAQQAYVALPLEENGPEGPAPGAAGQASTPGPPPEGIVSPDGRVDFDQLFQAADLPPVTIPAEKAAQILGTIPDDLPRRVKRLVVRTSLDTLNDFDGTAAAETARATVRDAEEKSRRIVRLQEALRAEEEARAARVEGEIAALEAQIAARRELLAAAQLRAEEARRACQRRTDEFDQVILFFSVEARIRAEGAAEFEPGDGDAEKPAFLDEEAVMRLLGINRAAGAAAAPPPPYDEDELSVMPPAAPLRPAPARPRHPGSLVPP